ncbi:aspartic peptidase domain-containing protein [Tricladium varicosporioides]|nr:aspartic peptidase domain-containing protein [Hymenoscyphus varicosporioides]
MKSISLSQVLVLGTAISSISASPNPQINSQSSHHIPLSRQLERRDATGTQILSSKDGFWFGNFSVGGSPNLKLLIDTGSGDLILNPKLYTPGKTSKSLNLTFTNTYGTTSSNGSGNGLMTGSLYDDQVAFGGYTATQTVGSVTSAEGFPGDGIVGFSGPMFNQFPNNATSFFQTLCTQGKVSECRFGMALYNESIGSLVLGKLDTSLYAGSLTVAPIITGWVPTGDLAINGKIVARDLVIELDSGTATVVGPINAVTEIFNATGIQGVLQNTTEGPILTGYFPCDKPPTVGFSFPSQTNASTATGSISKNSTIFNIPSSLWAVKNNGGNNCTAVMSGQDYSTYPGLWVVGQPFFQGRYIDHNIADGTVGIANLKTSASANTTTTQSTSAGTMKRLHIEWLFIPCVALWLSLI